MNLKRLAKRALATLSLSMLCLIAFAQGHQISGTVIDGTGEPIIGANVLEVGTTNGVITDIDGNFKLSVQPNAKIQVSFIGYITQTVTVGSQKNIKVTLKEDAQALDEVVVIGYGAVKKRDLTGAVASVKSEDITMNPGVNPMDALRSVRELRGVKPAYCRMSGQAANFNMGDTPPLRCGSHSMRRTNASSTGSLMRVSLLMKKR